MDIVPTTSAGILRAVEALRAGEVIAYPTETVYGLGVDPFNAAALERLYAVKKRDEGNPVLLIVAGLDQLAPIVARMSPKASAYAKAFWPGPLSLVLPPAVGVPRSLLGPDGNVCVRWTSSEIAAALCREFNGAIVSTSANLSGEPPARNAQDVPRDGVAICIDGGEAGAGAASTVLNPETGAVLREGAISRDDLARVRALHN